MDWRSKLLHWMTLILLKEAAVKGRNKERDREDLAFSKTIQK